MGFVDIPDEAHAGSNRAFLHLDREELAYTIRRLQSLVQDLPLSCPRPLPAGPSSVAASQEELAFGSRFERGLNRSAALLPFGLQTSSSVSRVDGFMAITASPSVQTANQESSSFQSVGCLMSGMHLECPPPIVLPACYPTDSYMPVGSTNSTGLDKPQFPSGRLSSFQADDRRTAFGVDKSTHGFLYESPGPYCPVYSISYQDSKGSPLVTHNGVTNRIVDIRGQQAAVDAHESISRSTIEVLANSIGLSKGDRGEGYTGLGALVRVREESSAWKARWTTAAAEHNGDKIMSMVYSNSLEELLGGEEHTGWLLTASRNLLNLWQSTSHQLSSGALLQLMHSQSTEFVMEDIDIDASAKVLLGFCAHPRDKGVCISLHSLGGETFLKYKGMIRVSNKPFCDLKKQAEGSLQLLHVASLQPFGGPLRSSLAAAVGIDVFVYDLSVASVNAFGTSLSKAVWKAHDAHVSCMHSSNFACAIFTGSRDGYISLWDLKSKPSLAVFTEGSDYWYCNYGSTHSNCGMDGVLKLWDIRSSKVCLESVVPDGKPILNMNANPLNHTTSFTTRMGLYSLELSGPVLSPFIPLPAAGPCTDVRWNTTTQQVYVSGTNGAVTVYATSSQT